MRREFEFDDGLYRYAIGWHTERPLPPDRAVFLVSSVVLRDPFRLASLISWAQYEGLLRSLGFGPHDRNRAAGDLLNSIRFGQLRVYQREDAPRRTYSHTLEPIVAEPTPAPSEPEEIIDDDRALLISRCDPELRPDGPLKFTYLMRGLSGRPATLRFVSETFPGGVIYERALEPAETTDGAHDMDWDGVIANGELRGRRLLPAYSPATVEVIHDETYRDSASFTIPHRRVTILQFEDLSFATDRSILLPNVREAVDEQTSHPRDHVGGLEVIVAALRFADRNRQKSVLVAGHTDTAGSTAHNLALSNARAENVAAFLAGDVDAWAEQCQATYEIADFKSVHRWVAVELGWDTDPGELDNEWTARAREARDEFRQRCNEELGLELERHVKQNKADWEAIFTLYDQALMRRLDCDADVLAKLREHVQFLEPATIGCGEHWPVEAIGLDDHALEENRRVELLFFDPGEEPELPGDPPGREIYGCGEYLPEYLPADPNSFIGSRDYEVWIELRDHWVLQTVGNVEYRLRGPIPSCPHEREGTTDGQGRLREGELAPGDYIVEVCGSFAVVGARYAALCYVDDAPDVYRLHSVGNLEQVPDSPRIYDNPWRVVTVMSADDFIDGIEDSYGEQEQVEEDD